MAGNLCGCKEKKRTPYRKVISRKEDVKKWSKSTVQSRERGLRDEGDTQSAASRFFRVTSGSYLGSVSEQSVFGPRQNNSGGSATWKEI
jgi:hypothetical protein